MPPTPLLKVKCELSFEIFEEDKIKLKFYLLHRQLLQFPLRQPFQVHQEGLVPLVRLVFQHFQECHWLRPLQEDLECLLINRIENDNPTNIYFQLHIDNQIFYLFQFDQVFHQCQECLQDQLAQECQFAHLGHLHRIYQVVHIVQAYHPYHLALECL